jgi:hypothetical protein
MVGGAVGAISAIDRLDHLADLEGRVVRGASGNQLCPHIAHHTPDKTRVRTRAKRCGALGPQGALCREWWRMQAARRRLFSSDAARAALRGGHGRPRVVARATTHGQPQPQ